jgi:hypothetical protein
MLAAISGRSAVLAAFALLAVLADGTVCRVDSRTSAPVRRVRALGAHLSAAIRTGRLCSYAPPGEAPLRWSLSWPPAPLLRQP